jgi:hypothetical protein
MCIPEQVRSIRLAFDKTGQPDLRSVKIALLTNWVRLEEEDEADEQVHRNRQLKILVD